MPGSADDSRDLSEYEAPAEAADDDSFLDEPPVVRLTFHEQDFAVFPSQRDDSPGVYVDGEQGLVKVAAPELHVPADAFWEPLECFFSALRVPEALGEFLEDDTELTLTFPDLEMTVQEDNAYSRDISLSDISQLALGFGYEASLHVVVREAPRFISRYNELASQMNAIADADEEDEMEEVAGAENVDRVVGESVEVGIDADEVKADGADAEEADADEADAEEADADEADAEEADAEEADADEADADEADAEGADADGADAEEADADEADADGADAEEADADGADAEGADADVADADVAEADVDANKADADEAEADVDANEAEADEADAVEASANEADADEAEIEAEPDKVDAKDAMADVDADADDAEAEQMSAIETSVGGDVPGMTEVDDARADGAWHGEAVRTDEAEQPGDAGEARAFEAPVHQPRAKKAPSHDTTTHESIEAQPEAYVHNTALAVGTESNVARGADQAHLAVEADEIHDPHPKPTDVAEYEAAAHDSGDHVAEHDVAGDPHDSGDEYAEYYASAEAAATMSAAAANASATESAAQASAAVHDTGEAEYADDGADEACAHPVILTDAPAEHNTEGSRVTQRSDAGAAPDDKTVASNNAAPTTEAVAEGNKRAAPGNMDGDTKRPKTM